METSRKITFHIPARDLEIGEIVDMAAEALGCTTSEWVYRIVRQKLKSAGILDHEDKIQYGKVEQELLPELPPASKTRTAWLKRKRG
jgi:hypothetical protein